MDSLPVAYDVLSRRTVILGLGLLGPVGVGCSRYKATQPPTLDPALVDKCRAGDDDACDAAVRTGLADQVVDDEIERCESGASESCDRAGRWVLAARRSWAEARKLFERGCADGHAGSCAGYVDFLLWGHHYVWACMDPAARAPTVFQSGDTQPLPLRLTAAGSSTPLELEIGETGPEQAALRECLNDAFAHTRFPALAGVHVTSFEYTPNESSWIDPHRQTDLTHAYDWEGAAASCPDEMGSACRVLDPPKLRRIYAPRPKVVDTFRVLPTAPYSLELVFSLCVDARAYSEHVEIVDDAGERVLAEAWLSKIETWRSRPALVDGKAIPSCARLRVKLQWLWRADQPPRKNWLPSIKY